MTPHPWAPLQMLPDWHVDFRHALDGGRLAVTDYDRRTIWIDKRLTQVERRVAICHELIHVQRGDRHKVGGHIERSIDLRVARTLIPLDKLRDAIRWTSNTSELADEAWVTRWLTELRIHHLTEDEWTYLELDKIGETA